MCDLKINDIFFFNEDISKIRISPSSIEHVYLLILQNDFVNAKIVLKKLDSSRANWLRILISILEGYVSVYPTYFQIRNYLEIDLDFFIKNKKIDYVEQILGSLDLFSVINIEIYKYVARVMYSNNLYSLALRYMNKSKNVYYNDAELHFMYAKYYLNIKDYEVALFHVKECLRLIPDYYPALVLNDKIEELLF